MKYAIAIILLMVSVCNAAAMKGEEAEVQRAYQMYRAALLNQDGVSAWKKVDYHTRNFFEDIAKKSLTIKREDLDRLDILSKIMILRMRMDFRKDHLRKLNGSKIFILDVEKGFISKSTVQAIKQLDEVKIKGKLAHGFISKRQDIPIFYFIKEDGGWKVALWKNLETVNIELKQLVVDKGVSENDYIKAIIEQAYKSKLDDRIFDGPLK